METFTGSSSRKGEKQAWLAKHKGIWSWGLERDNPAQWKCQAKETAEVLKGRVSFCHQRTLRTFPPTWREKNDQIGVCTFPSLFVVIFISKFSKEKDGEAIRRIAYLLRLSHSAPMYIYIYVYVYMHMYILLPLYVRVIVHFSEVPLLNNLESAQDKSVNAVTTPVLFHRRKQRCDTNTLMHQALLWREGPLHREPKRHVHMQYLSSLAMVMPFVQNHVAHRSCSSGMAFMCWQILGITPIWHVLDTSLNRKFLPNLIWVAKVSGSASGLLFMGPLGLSGAPSPIMLQPLIVLSGVRRIWCARFCKMSAPVFARWLVVNGHKEESIK